MPPLVVKGSIHDGSGHFRKRMTDFCHVFEMATGEKLFPGTLNIHLPTPISINEHFRISGASIEEPEQDLLFEICRVNSIWAYRIRPFQPATGNGGHGDHVIEIACSEQLRTRPDFLDSEIEIVFFR
jgi:hypothetical protein